MRKASVLALLLLYPTTLLAQDYNPLRADAKPKKLLDTSWNADTSDTPPDGYDTRDSAGWVMKRWESEQKSTIANFLNGYFLGRASKGQPPCLKHHSAFSFKKLNDNEFEVLCYAGKSKKITHVVEAKIKLSPAPSSCLNEQKAREKLPPGQKFTRQEVSSFWLSVKGQCALTANFSDAANPIQKSQLIDPESVTRALSQLPDLERHVNGESKVKRGPAVETGIEEPTGQISCRKDNPLCRDKQESAE